MGKWVEAAQPVRDTMNKAGAKLSNSEAAKLPTLYPEWTVGIKITQKMIDERENRFRVGNIVYFTNNPHTTIEEWKPSINTASIWTPINTDHAGTMDDPIPAVAGTIFYKDLIYSEGDKLYRCTRQDSEDGTILYYLPSALVGHYFEEVTI